MSNPTRAESQKLEINKTSDQYYVDSYSHFGIHEEMLKDKVRTLAYRDAILFNQASFKDKIVLDIGCGTGILSMFCAKAGAKHVYAIDMSDIIDQAREIVNLNGFGDKITLIKGRVEDLTLPVDHVDIIVSEWMGYFLLYESMLNTVLYARDKWLRKDTGMILPNKARMYIAGIEDAEYKQDKIHYWDSVYGFDFSPIKKLALLEPLVDTLENSNQIITTKSQLMDIDIMTVNKEDLDFIGKFSVDVRQQDYLHAFVAWFDIDFTQGHKHVFFSTSPYSKYTHWKQTIFYLKDDLQVFKGDKIEGELDCKANKKNPRELDINIKVSFKGRQARSEHEQFYQLR
eukprot:CAMPEP_0117438700 /NCGR_PEP_ID=MMETSP0759-20121206/2188_1 /TAXON_ID=63605 /ORGANISM="Percolomonas cosmopolitus, Strain WS" /LENGTH=342 /DNA_ID=CAMNT_0005230399 /DNA_START=37 /DNA_END=1065 /DNA_ORIENTATION=+